MEKINNQSQRERQIQYHEGLQRHSPPNSDLEVVPAGFNAGKEALVTDIPQLEVQSWDPADKILKSQGSEIEKPRISQTCSRRWFLILFLSLIIVCFIVVIVSVLVTQLHRQKTSSSASSSSSPVAVLSTASSPAPPVPTSSDVDPVLNAATDGALNGTYLTALLPADQVDWVLLFFQHENADIKYARKSTDNTWQASESIGKVPKAMGKTPLASVSYQTKANARYATWQLYYADPSGTLQNIYNVDATNNWTTGSLGSHSFQISQSPGAALAADQSSWYGPKPNVGLGGVRLLAGGNDSLVHEYLYTIESDSWEAGFTFPNSNGNAGVSVTHFQSLSEVVLVNSGGQLEYWWRDDDILNVNSSSYYFGIWNKGATSITAIHPDSAICTSNLTFIQSPANTIQNIARQDANKHARWGPTTNVSSNALDAVLPGSSIACNTQESKDSLHTFYAYFQTAEGQVVEYGKGLTDAAWTIDHAPS